MTFSLETFLRRTLGIGCENIATSVATPVESSRLIGEGGNKAEGAHELRLILFIANNTILYLQLKYLFDVAGHCCRSFVNYAASQPDGLCNSACPRAFLANRGTKSQKPNIVAA
jgi:hypothetical protein